MIATISNPKKEDSDLRDGFIFYESFRSAMKELPVETQALLYNALADYALYDIVPEFGDDGIARGFFALMRPQIDANNRKRDAGARGGRPAISADDDGCEAPQETKEEPNANQSETIAKPYDNQTTTMTEAKEKENGKAKANANANAKGNAKSASVDKPRSFAIPTVEEIRAFCVERGNGIDPQQFYDYYEAKGWLIGSQPMKNWQAAVRSWEGREPARAPNAAGACTRKDVRPQIEQHARTDQDLAHLLVDLDGEMEMRNLINTE